jgi:SAM-dependent methyltransferase
VRAIDERAIKAHADQRFRSEYDYALFEYYRSAKVIAFLERAGVAVRGRVLDAGCGGGGMPLSLGEEVRNVVGIDPIDRFGDAGARLARERGLPNVHFARADGMALPFANGVFDLVLSHAVIEHVADAALYLRECARVLATDGRMYLDLALSVVRGRAPAAPEAASAAAPDDRTARRIRHVQLPVAPRAVDAEGAGARELLHPRCPKRRRQA